MITSQNHNYQSLRKIKRDYQQSEFKNPYFDHKRQHHSGGFNTKFYLKLIFGVFFVYVLFYSNLLKIDVVEVSGLDMISNSQFRQTVDQSLNDARWWLFPHGHMFFFSKNKLSRTIENEYGLESLMINRGWKRLDISIQERISYLILFNRQKFYFVDQGGQVTQQLTKEQAVQYWDRFPILNINQEEIDIGDQLISGQMVNFLLRLNEKIMASPLRKQGFESNGEQEVIFLAKEGWRAYFDINSDLDIAMENLLLVLNEKIEDQSQLEYIDLRFDNKVFYK